MNDVEFLKEAYYHHIQQKQQISSGASIPIGILGLIAGGFVYLVNNLNTIKSDKIGIMICVLIIFGISLLVNAYFLIRVLCRNEYSYLPASKEIMSHKKNLAKFYDREKETCKAYGHSDKNLFVNEQFEEYLCNTFTECIDKNFETNKKRVCYLRKASTCIVITLCIASISLLIYATLSTDKKGNENSEYINIYIDTYYESPREVYNGDNMGDVSIFFKTLEKGDVEMPDNNTNSNKEEKNELPELNIPKGPDVVNLMESFNDRKIKKSTDEE